jgi:hypothetical protein
MDATVTAAVQAQLLVSGDSKQGVSAEERGGGLALLQHPPAFASERVLGTWGWGVQRVTECCRVPAFAHEGVLGSGSGSRELSHEGDNPKKKGGFPIFPTLTIKDLRP